MMSLIDLDDDQRWVPTHVNVTVLRARGLRTKGKHGSRYLYTIIQVGKEKYTTGLVEKAAVPEWNEECCFELLPGILEEGGRGAYPPGSGDLVLTVMHRVLIGLDVFLGQTIVPLDKIFQEGMCPRDEWFKLNSKAGRKEKERGELQLTVQFTRNNMTASMFDLTMKDKPRSAFGKLKDRVTGRKRGDVESSSAIVPGRYAALSGSLGQPFGEEVGVAVETPDVEIAEEKRSKMKDFFKGRLRKSSDTKSCSSLASESSVSSMASENPGPPPSLDLLSDPPSSPIYTTKVRVDTHYGETDLAKKVLTSQHTTKALTHKRALSDEASKITTAFPRTNPAVESLKGQTMTQSKSSLCINGSHVYDSEPSTPRISGAHPSKLGPAREVLPTLSFPAEPHQEKLEVSPKVESSSDVPPPLPPRSPVPPQCSPPSATLSGLVSPDDYNHTNPFTPSPSPSSTPISPSNPFPSRMQCNPFFEELIAEESQKSPPFASCSSSGSSPFHYTTLLSQPSPAHDVKPTNMAFIKRERPRPVARQISLPALLPKAAMPDSPNHCAPRSMSESAGEWDDSFDAFASSRLNSPKGSLPQKQLRTSPTSSHRHNYLPVNTNNHAQELQVCEEEPPPLPPRRLLRNSVNEIYSDGWLHRGQELAVHKEAYLLSQTGVASLQHGREGDSKRNSISPDPQTSSENSDCLSINSQAYRNTTSPGLMSEEKLKKFKYEPLEDETDRWGGMLFEQDLYGRICRGNYGQTNVNSHHLSVDAEETAGYKITSMNSGPIRVLDSEINVADLLNLSSTPPPQPDAKVVDITTTPVEQTNPPETTCINNNVSFSLTLGDLNMNVNNLDFSFIDSDGSSQSEVADTLKGISSLQPSEDSLASYHAETVTTPEDRFTLKDTYIPEMNSSFEIPASSNKLCKVSPVCQDNCQDCRCELNNTVPHGNSSGQMAALSSQNQTYNPPNLQSKEDVPTGVDDFIKTQKDFDDNGNPQGKIDTLNQKEPTSGVLMHRLRTTLPLSVAPPYIPQAWGPSAGASTTLAVAPYTSSYSTISTTDQPLVDARHSLLPEETQPASNLPHLESRPHPVKPLTSSQSEKKEGRSVLEKLKSTIHPGRATHQVVAEPEKSQEVTVDNSAQYQHLTNMELISLLLQQEMDMQKQQAASERQEAQLQKCEAELKKVKLQVRDLEDYIDNLLLRIMEQTPTLLQVRTRHK
ncbi:Rab11 family-interacting protein 5 [Larimichthys crocea]|uniref:Rab11 family-interacting protein 5 n=1 Tax=Larimichthys crocea TaxID=215358 RepID=A0A6G0I318_LARCR|nr:Rab11 family-interacting protein 5 [Larimichthys crocea]